MKTTETHQCRPGSCTVHFWSRGTHGFCIPENKQDKMSQKNKDIRKILSIEQLLAILPAAYRLSVWINKKQGGTMKHN